VGKTLLKKEIGNVFHLAILGVFIVAIFSGLFFSAQAGIFVIIAAWVVFLTWQRPEQAFWALLLFAPLLPVLKITQDLSFVTPLKDFIIATLFIRVVVLPLLQKKDPYRRNEILLPVFMLIFYVCLSVLFSESTILGILRLRDILLYLPLLWIGRAIVSTPQDYLVFKRIIILGFSLVVLLLGFQYLFFGDGMVLRYDPQDGSWIRRASSTLAHPNILGAYLICILPFTIYLSWQKLWKNWRYKFLALVSFIGVIALYFTYSRGVWIAFTFSIVALIITHLFKEGRFKIRALFFAAVIILVVLIGLPRTRNLLRTAFDPTYASNMERLEIVISLFANSTNLSTFFGNGLGDVTQATGRMADISVEDILANDARSVQVAKAQTFVDNAVLKTWAEIGFFGVLIVSWMIFGVLKFNWKLAVRNKNKEEGVYHLSLFAVTIGLIILSFFLDVPETFPVALYWWVFVGVAQALPYIKMDIID